MDGPFRGLCCVGPSGSLDGRGVLDGMEGGGWYAYTKVLWCVVVRWRHIHLTHDLAREIGLLQR